MVALLTITFCDRNLFICLQIFIVLASFCYIDHEMFHSLAAYMKDEETLKGIIYPSISRSVVRLPVPIDINARLLIHGDG